MLACVPHYHSEGEKPKVTQRKKTMIKQSHNVALM